MINKKIQNKSLLYDYCKIIVTFIVVFAHITRMYTGRGVLIPYYNSDFFVILTDFIYSFHMPLFMMLSGCVYYLCIFELKKYKEKLDFIKNKAKRLLIPYFIFGFFYVAPVMVLFNFSDLNYIQYCIKGIIIPLQSRHLWFLFYLFIYYMYTYFFLKNTNNLSLLILNIIFMYIVYLIQIPLISDISYYLIFFTIGNILELYFEYFTKKCSIIFLLLEIILYLILYIMFKEISFIKPIIAFLGSLFFVGFINFLIIKINFSEKTKLIFAFFKKYCMGIYLFHPMIIYIFYFYLNTKIESQFILVSITYIFCIILSIFFTYLVRLCKMKFVIGES